MVFYKELDMDGGVFL